MRQNRTRLFILLLPGFILGLLGLAIGTVMTGSTAYADGGAPNLAYVAGASGGIGVIDVQQQKISQTIKVPDHPQAIALSLDGRFLYVTQPLLRRLSIIAAKTGGEICHANLPGTPSLLAFDGYAKLLYVAGSGSATVTSVDPEQCAIKRSITTSGPVYGLAMAALSSSDATSHDQLWVANEKAVHVFDAANGKALGAIAVPAGPRYLSIPPGGTVYATTEQGKILALDLKAHTVSRLLSGGDYGPMDFDETTGEIYVPDRKQMTLVILRPVNAGFQLPKEPERILKLDVPPESVAITSDGQLGFAALRDGRVVMYDIPGQQEISRIPAGGTPGFIITGLYPPALGTTPQQASQIQTVASIVGYVIVAVLLVVPCLLFLRFSRAHKRATATAVEQRKQQDRLQRDARLTDRIH
jgi:hypothetical protein